MLHRVPQARAAVDLSDGWESSIWRDIAPLELRCFMGSCPDHFPRTQVKLQYDATAVYLFFDVQDRYVRAVTTRQQGEVWKDSCVEFFFSPAGIEHGYFNLEVNCGGFVRFSHQSMRGQNRVMIAPAHIAQLGIVHPMPAVVAHEIESPLRWTIAYRLPMELVRAYSPQGVSPAGGVSWRANFYKCADDCSHPHWLTWAPVHFPTPNFHLPEFFGTILFE